MLFYRLMVYQYFSTSVVVKSPSSLHYKKKTAGACICLRVRGFLKQDYGIQLKRKLAQIEHLV